jgi:hypothetical protein
VVQHFDLAHDAIDQFNLSRRPVFARHAIERLTDDASEVIGQDGVAVPVVEFLHVDLDGRSLQNSQPALEELIHDLFVQTRPERLRSGILGGA